MENYPLQYKDPFTKAIEDSCRVLAVWKNRYAANDGVAFAMTSEE